MRLRFRCVSMLALLMVVTSAPAMAQTPPDDPDLDINFPQPDFTLSSLPTTLRVPRHKSAFRVTHRFTRSLNDDFGSVLEDFFGLDSGAQIGLEYRFGLFRGTQVGIHRTSDRTIEFFGQHEIVAQGESFPLTVQALATIDGTNNFRDRYTPALGAVISRTHREWLALYLEPMWVHNARLRPPDGVVDVDADQDDDSFLLGLGTRVRVRPTVYLVFEGAPRLAGHDPLTGQMSAGIEKRAGGHMFQLTFSNGFGTTIGQLARGARNNEDWHLGFSISRKFF